MPFHKGYKPTETHLKRLSESHLGQIAWNKGKKMDQNFRDKCRQRQLGKFIRTEEGVKSFKIKMTGKNNPRWIDDKTQLKKSLNKRIRKSSAYYFWLNEVKKRDNHKCRINNSDCNGQIEAHHILNWVDFPELRYDINNGITLCHFHHPRGRKEEEKLSSYFQNVLLTLTKIQ